MPDGENARTVQEINDALDQINETSPDYIQYLRQTGQDKPDDVTWPEWLAPISLNHRHETLALLAAAGLKQNQIARIVGYSQSRVSLLINSPEIRELIRRNRDELYGRSLQDRLNAVAGKAMDRIEGTLANEEDENYIMGIDPAKRTDVARWLVEKLTGKAPQTINKSESLLVTLLSRVEQVYTPNSPGQPQLPGNIIDVPHRTNSQQQRQQPALPLPDTMENDPIGAWVSSHIEKRDFSKKSLTSREQDYDDETRRAYAPASTSPTPHDRPELPTPFDTGQIPSDKDLV